MTPAERMWLRKLHEEVMTETDHARVKFAVDKGIEALPYAYGVVATLEELGKLARCYNKLVIAEIPEVRRQWRNEAAHRIVTCLSLLERLHLKMREE